MELFNLGRITVTPAAFATLAACGQIPILYLARHVSGDFGTLSEEDRSDNIRAMKDGHGRVLSTYDLANGQRIWVITNLLESGQNDTRLLLRHEC